jgi:hypothetical protein
LHFAAGPPFAQLCICGVVFAACYLGALRALGVLPPMREWIPARRTPELTMREAA